MAFSYLSAVLFSSLILFVDFSQSAACRPFNYVYPAPRNMTGDLITAASQGLNATFTLLLQNETVATVTNTTSFSLQAYSLYDSQPLLTFHHSAPSLATSEEGTQVIDSDTVYRIASISKALTVYIFLLAAGDSSFNDPITDYIPELANYVADNDSNDTVKTVDWSSITVGSLAEQLSGVARDPYGGSQTDLVYQQLLGLPPPQTAIPDSEYCVQSSGSIGFPCNRTAFFDTNLFRPPTAAPFLSPVYANVPYQIFAYALENITNTSFPDLFQQYLVDDLDLTSTFYTVPSNFSNSVIPTNLTVSLFADDFLDGAPYGGYFSSTNDLTTIGRSILNSTFLTSAQTNRWLKPVSFLPPSVLTDNAGVFQAVGAPWEIIRAPAPTAPLSGQSVGQNATAAETYQTWMYTKEGDLGVYSGVMALVPEFDVGFEILAAGTQPRIVVLQLADYITETFVPALFETARQETAQTYAGSYVDESTNSSAILAIAGPTDVNQGLILQQLVYNGTDFYALYAQTLYGLPDASLLEVILFPDGLESRVGDNGTVEEGWRTSVSVPGLDPVTGAFSSACFQWAGIGGLAYGGIAFDDFRFTVDEQDGRIAIGLDVPALGVNMTRAG